MEETRFCRPRGAKWKEPYAHQGNRWRRETASQIRGDLSLTARMERKGKKGKPPNRKKKKAEVRRKQGERGKQQEWRTGDRSKDGKGGKNPKREVKVNKPTQEKEKDNENLREKSVNTWGGTEVHYRDSHFQSKVTRFSWNRWSKVIKGNEKHQAMVGTM